MFSASNSRGVISCGLHLIGDFVYYILDDNSRPLIQ